MFVRKSFLKRRIWMACPHLRPSLASALLITAIGLGYAQAEAPKGDISAGENSPPPIMWQQWSDKIFEQARREHKFVLLNLENSGSHWCHVMDDQTYNDPDVRQLLEKSYLTVKVDQSQRPDIYNRYRGYGLPATILFNTDESEIVRKEGYLSSGQMARLLQAVIDDPSPGPSVVPESIITYSTDPTPSPSLIAELGKDFKTQYEVSDQLSAFGVEYLDEDEIEYGIVLARRGDKEEEKNVREKLDDAERLIDSTWGGVFQSLVVPLKTSSSEPAFQYSRVQISGKVDTTGDSWNDAHYEKPLITEAQAIQIYAQAYGHWRTPEYLVTARNVERYVYDFLTSSEGAFYMGQDGDVAPGIDRGTYFARDDLERRALGTPKVDEHVFARENGLMIDALCSLYAVTGEDATLKEAERSADWVIAHRGLVDGGFSHDEHDVAGPFLGDSVAMGHGFLALYEVTGDRQWLKRAAAAEHFIETNFSSDSGTGFITSKTPTNRAYNPHPDRGENVQVARFANLLGQYTGNREDEDMAAQAMRYLVTPEIAKGDLSAPVLLAATEFTQSPVHITVVGKKSDPAAQALFRAAMDVGFSYKRLEWWDAAEGTLARNDRQYPPLPYAAAFISTTSTMSAPIVDPHILEVLSAKASE